jgi:hypothetical protein
MDPEPLHIVIDVDSCAVPISGHVHPASGASLPFTGWTGLFAALHAVAGEDRTTHKEEPCNLHASSR